MTTDIVNRLAALYPSAVASDALLAHERLSCLPSRKHKLVDEESTETQKCRTCGHVRLIDCFAGLRTCVHCRERERRRRIMKLYRESA